MSTSGKMVQRAAWDIITGPLTGKFLFILSDAILCTPTILILEVPSRVIRGKQREDGQGLKADTSRIVDLT